MARAWVLGQVQHCHKLIAEIRDVVQVGVERGGLVDVGWREVGHDVLGRVVLELLVVGHKLAHLLGWVRFKQPAHSSQWQQL